MFATGTDSQAVLGSSGGINAKIGGHLHVTLAVVSVAMCYVIALGCTRKFI